MVGPISVLVQQISSGDAVLDFTLLLLATAAFASVWSLRGGRQVKAYAHLAWQIGAVLALEQAYEFIRGAILSRADLTDIAFINSYRVLDLELQHGFFFEYRAEQFFLHFHALMSAVDLFYIVGHVAGTIGVLVWIYVWHRQRYPFIRNLIMLVTAMALIVFYLFPTAPPRMLGTYGFVDPLVMHHLAAAGGDQPGSYTYNPYAAMPSLHVAYALVVAIAVFLAERRRWVRALAAAYPCAMATTVIVSGNHWALDVVGAVLTVGVAVAALAGASLALAHLKTAVVAAHSAGAPSG